MVSYLSCHSMQIQEVMKNQEKKLSLAIHVADEYFWYKQYTHVSVFINPRMPANRMYNYAD